MTGPSASSIVSYTMSRATPSRRSRCGPRRSCAGSLSLPPSVVWIAGPRRPGSGLAAARRQALAARSSAGGAADASRRCEPPHPEYRRRHRAPSSSSRRWASRVARASSPSFSSGSPGGFSRVIRRSAAVRAPAAPLPRRGGRTHPGAASAGCALPPVRVGWRGARVRAQPDARPSCGAPRCRVAALRPDGRAGPVGGCARTHPQRAFRASPFLRLRRVCDTLLARDAALGRAPRARAEHCRLPRGRGLRHSRTWRSSASAWTWSTGWSASRRSLDRIEVIARCWARRRARRAGARRRHARVRAAASRRTRTARARAGARATRTCWRARSSSAPATPASTTSPPRAREYHEMLHSAAGGGLLTAFTAALKFLSSG